METVFNQLTDYKLNKFNAIYPLGKEELNLFKKAGRFSKKIIRNHYRLSNRMEACINDYEALSYYCQNGSAPWWISANGDFRPAKILYNLFVDDYQLFVQFIQSVNADTSVMKRLVQLIGMKDFFHIYNRFNPADEFLKYFLLFIKPKAYTTLVVNWLNHLIIGKYEDKVIEFGKWLKGACENQTELSSSVRVILKNIISKIKNESKEQVLLTRIDDMHRQLMT